MTAALVAASAVALLYSFSPVDSCRSRIDLARISDEAVLFAELAARQGGDGPIVFARLLEVAGRFEDAAAAYGIALGGAEEEATRSWLSDRRSGSMPIDTVLVLTAVVRNAGATPAVDLMMVMPLPRSHPPYQTIDLLAGRFHEEDGRLVCMIERLDPGVSRELTVMIRLRQRPYTFRPIPDPIGDTPLDEIAALLGGTTVPTDWSGTGPCLDMAFDFSERAALLGLDAGVEGGLVRRGDSLVFHAWNLLLEGVPGMPLDPLMFQTDSLRAIGHCPSDVIPVWDLGSTGGHELSACYPGQEAELEITLQARFAPLDPESILFRLLEASSGIGE
jgi:hypothetical protein